MTPYQPPQGRTGAQCVIDGLLNNGCEVVFGYPGGQAIDIFDKLYGSPLRLVLPRHEQGGIHMADGYARATGRVGCAIVTSGPGATNTVTGLATAMMDGVPLVVIAGQVSLGLIGTDAFQEADNTGITRSVTKHNYLVRSVDELPRVIAEAFFIASTGKPGPVLIDIPKNVQQAITFQPDVQDVAIRAYHPTIQPPPAQVARLADAINKAHRPVLYIGGGAIISGSCALLRSIAETYDPTTPSSRPTWSLPPARVSTTASPAASPTSPRAPRSPTSTWMPRPSAKTSTRKSPSAVTCA